MQINRFYSHLFSIVWLLVLMASLDISSNACATGAAETNGPAGGSESEIAKKSAIHAGFDAFEAPVLSTASNGDEHRYEQKRKQMVNRQIFARGVENRRTLQAMRTVPRHLFVREDDRSRAYMDSPLPIGHGQTISQPYIVAYMTQLTDPEPGMNVLEIGTGSGYQAAVLAAITDEVFTIEIIEELAEWGEQNLREAGFDEVQVKHADGYHGWEEHAPFDAIVVTAAADHIPPPLVEQLRDGGRMVIPVGSPFRTQNLMLVEKQGDDILTRNLMPVRFVPFTREEE